jgi:hypothetical protein
MKENTRKVKSRGEQDRRREKLDDDEIPWMTKGSTEHGCTRTRLLNRVVPATGKHFRSHSRTRQFNSARTSESCNSAALFTCCDAIKAGLLLPPVLRCASNPCYVAPASTSARMKGARRAWLHRISSELVMPDHCLRSAASLSDSPRHTHIFAFARTVVYLY